jgi:hypothetical protein
MLLEGKSSAFKTSLYGGRGVFPPKKKKEKKKRGNKPKSISSFYE